MAIEERVRGGSPQAGPPRRQQALQTHPGVLWSQGCTECQQQSLRLILQERGDLLLSPLTVQETEAGDPNDTPKPPARKVK